MEAKTPSDLRDVYDMDKDYKLLSWEIPHLKIKISIGDKFIKDGVEKTLVMLDYASDSLGIHSMYPFLDEDFHTLIDFVDLMEDGRIVKVN